MVDPRQDERSKFASKLSLLLDPLNCTSRWRDFNFFFLYVGAERLLSCCRGKEACHTRNLVLVPIDLRSIHSAGLNALVSCCDKPQDVLDLHFSLRKCKGGRGKVPL